MTSNQIFHVKLFGKIWTEGTGIVIAVTEPWKRRDYIAEERTLGSSTQVNKIPKLCLRELRDSLCGDFGWYMNFGRPVRLANIRTPRGYLENLNGSSDQFLGQKLDEPFPHHQSPAPAAAFLDVLVLSLVM